MVIGQPLLINWEIHPLMSAKMKISLVFWTVSTETCPRDGGASPPGTFPKALLKQWHAPCRISDGVFINVANVTLAHRDSYLEYLKAGKQDTLTSLRTAPFYCVNTSYPMHNCFTGWHDRSRRKPENLIGKLNFYKLIPYLTDSGVPPNGPRSSTYLTDSR